MPQTADGVSYVTFQPGPQEQALSSPADVVVMGGANGGGKSYWLLLEAARHIDVPGYRGVIFRRESTDITDPGGLWDTSMGVFPQIGGWPRTNKLDWVFEPDARVSFRGLPHFKDAVSWDGKELAFIGFDEGQLFTEMQFWYLFSRRRSTCGVNPCIRMSCNPVHEDDPTGGWLKKLIGWWLDWDTGYPIKERSGVIRWFCRINNEIIWGDSSEELIQKYGDPNLAKDHEDQPVQPMSLTFVPSKLKDNPLLMKATPQYRASLMALPDHLRKQKLDGNWNAKLEAGTFFKIGVMSRPNMIVGELPNDLRYCRAWDLAHTENAGDWTVGAKIGKDSAGNLYIADIIRGQWEAFNRDERMKIATSDDGYDCRVRIPQDPSAGVSEAARIQKTLGGYIVRAVPPRGKKEDRAGGFQSAFNAGNVKMLRAPWNRGLLQRLDSFPTKGIPDDEIDALADAYDELYPTNKLVMGFESRGDSDKDDDEKPVDHPFKPLIEPPAESEGPPKPAEPQSRRLIMGFS
jgi:predicted phage terminase large subunit-like protein